MPKIKCRHCGHDNEVWTTSQAAAAWGYSLSFFRTKKLIFQLIETGNAVKVGDRAILLLEGALEYVKNRADGRGKYDRKK